MPSRLSDTMGRGGPATIADRPAMREGPRDSARHLRHPAAMPALGQIEIGSVARSAAGDSAPEMREDSREVQPEKPAVVVVRITDSSSSAPY